LAKRWPDVWIGKLSQGEDWLASRNLAPAGLNSCPRQGIADPMLWTVDIALGFVFGVRSPCNISGEIILYFEAIDDDYCATFNLSYSNEWLLESDRERNGDEISPVDHQDESETVPSLSPAATPGTVDALSDPHKDEDVHRTKVEDSLRYNKNFRWRLALVWAVVVMMALLLLYLYDCFPWRRKMLLMRDREQELVDLQSYPAIDESTMLLAASTSVAKPRDQSKRLSTDQHHPKKVAVRLPTDYGSLEP
jgi:hypothetical protein